MQLSEGARKCCSDPAIRRVCLLELDQASGIPWWAVLRSKSQDFPLGCTEDGAITLEVRTGVPSRKAAEDARS